MGLLLVASVSASGPIGGSYMRFGVISAASGGWDRSGSKPWLLRRDNVTLCFEEDREIFPVTERLMTLGR